LRRFGVETNPGALRVAVETKLRRLGVETKLRRLSVETRPETLETYPRVPNPVVVDVS
jgi:hypothetical protein